MSSENPQQRQTEHFRPATPDDNETIEDSTDLAQLKTHDDNLIDLDEVASCTSSLEEEEKQPHWDVGSGDLAIFNDIPSDRNVVRFLQRARVNVLKILTSVLFRKRRIKYNIVLQVRFSNNYTIPPTPFKTEYIILESVAAIDDTYDVLSHLIEMKTFKFRVVYQILRLELNLKNLKPRSGSFIELPAKLPSLKAVINFRNYDNYCFKYALLNAAKHLLNNPKMVSMNLDGIDINSEQITYGGICFNFAGLTFPVEVRDVRIFEENNPSLSVNVFGLEKKRTQHAVVGPLYRTRREQETHINLLYLENTTKRITHYAYITRLATLVKGTTKNKSLAYYCNTCLMKFTALSRYREHKTEKNSCEVLQTLS